MTEPARSKKTPKTPEHALIQAEVARKDWLSSGSTLLNLALSGTTYGAFAKGKYFWVVGDSSSGKTFLTLTAFAEASINPEFDNYDLIFDNAEDGALMNIEKFYGKKLANRLQPPRSRNGVPVYSRTIEQFYYTLHDRLTLVESGKAQPFLYLLDSMDALSSKAEMEKFNKKANAAVSGAVVAGDYGDGKAIVNSRNIRTLTGRLRDTKCMAIILGQTRDKLNAGLFDPDKQTVAGGRALKFYASWQIWLSVGRELHKEVNGNKREIGIISHLKIRKNRLTGKNWNVDVPIYWSTGIDEVGSMVDFLIDEKHWNSGQSDQPVSKNPDDKKKPDRKSGKIIAPEFNFEGPRIKLIRHIEDNNLELDLRTTVAEVFQEIEDACVVHRKPRY